MASLIKTVETYRVADEAAAEKFIAEAKQDGTYNVVKCTTTKKELKVKGEVVDTWVRVEITKSFDDEKEPANTVSTVIYE